MTAIRGLAEIVLLVENVDRSLAFYRDELGLAVISPPDLKGPVFLQAGPQAGQQAGPVPQQIVLVPRPPNAPPAAQGLARNVHHIGLEIAREDYAAEEARLRALGHAIRHGEHPFLQVQAFYLDDPDGNEIELVCGK